MDIEDIMNKKKNYEYKLYYVRYVQGNFIGSIVEEIEIQLNKYFFWL